MLTRWQDRDLPDFFRYPDIYLTYRIHSLPWLLESKSLLSSSPRGEGGVAAQSRGLQGPHRALLSMGSCWVRFYNLVSSDATSLSFPLYRQPSGGDQLSANLVVLCYVSASSSQESNVISPKVGLSVSFCWQEAANIDFDIGSTNG